RSYRISRLHTFRDSQPSIPLYTSSWVFDDWILSSAFFDSRLCEMCTVLLRSRSDGALGALLFLQKRAGLFSPARSYKPPSAVGVDTLFYFSQMRESSFGMFRGDVGVARFPMLNGFF